jgi:hypothetical protein
MCSSSSCRRPSARIRRTVIGEIVRYATNHALALSRQGRDLKKPRAKPWDKVRVPMLRPKGPAFPDLQFTITDTALTGLAASSLVRPGASPRATSGRAVGAADLVSPRRSAATGTTLL